VSRGEYVQPGQALFELVALDPIEVEFQVTEVESGRVARGQTVEVRLEPFPDETFGAVVSYVSPVIDSRTRTLRVKGELDNTDGRLRPGLFARVDLGVDHREGVLMVPEDAILQRSDGAVVFRVGADRRAERVVVETGLHQNGAVEIVKGLARNDHVIVRGQARLVHGQPVVARNPDGTPAVDALPPVADAMDAGSAHP
jgi:membrane fusion protein, multidrug efflux system